jgi:protein TonB
MVGLQLAPAAGVKPRLMSLGIHASVIALLILVSSHPAIRPGARDAIDLAHSRVARLVAPKSYRGGGGGGQQGLLPASRGRLPKFARRQLIPPSARPPEVQAVLMIEPTLISRPT